MRFLPCGAQVDLPINKTDELGEGKAVYQRGIIEEEYMTSAQARQAYKKTEKMATIHPVKLIHLMYERVLAHLDIIIEAIDEKNVLKRGEHLGKVIAIITELNASIKKEDDSEAAGFLRGLYTAILVELPKVSIDNNRETAIKTRTYMLRLMEIWEQTAMREHGLFDSAEQAPVDHGAPGLNAMENVDKGRMPAGKSAEKMAVGGLSFSI